MSQRIKYVLSRKIQNDLISKHNGAGGVLAIPTIPNTITKQETEKPAPLTSLPENLNDWMNMSNNDFLRLTPSDIDKLSNTSFELAFGKTRRLGNLIWHRVYDNNPNNELISKAIDNRNDFHKSKVSGGDLVPATPPPSPVTPTLPETAQDWKNMTDDELLKITPDDILNNLSDASVQIAFREASTANPPGSFAIAQAIKERLLNNLNGKEGHLIFKDETGEEFSILPEVGDLLIFDANLLHRAETNINSTTERIVFCCNFHFLDINKKYLKNQITLI